MRRVALALTAAAVLLHARALGTVLVIRLYLRDSQSFPRQVAAIYAAIAEESR